MLGHSLHPLITVCPTQQANCSVVLYIKYTTEKWHTARSRTRPEHTLPTADLCAQQNNTSVKCPKNKVTKYSSSEKNKTNITFTWSLHTHVTQTPCPQLQVRRSLGTILFVYNEVLNALQSFFFFPLYSVSYVPSQKKKKKQFTWIYLHLRIITDRQDGATRFRKNINSCFSGSCFDIYTHTYTPPFGRFCLFSHFFFIFSLCASDTSQRSERKMLLKVQTSIRHINEAGTVSIWYLDVMMI